MEPAFHSGNYVLVELVGSEAGGSSLMAPKLRRGDVIIFHAPYNENQFLIKRVIAVAGDRIRIFRGRLLLDGIAQSDSHAYYADPSSAFWPTDWNSHGARDILISSGHYFVMGDNRDVSLDSRDWGFLPSDDVIGIVRLDLTHLELSW